MEPRLWGGSAGALVACAALAAAGWAELPRNFSREYEGTIDGKHGIRMTLRRQADRLTGSYRYLKVGKPLQLQGTLDREENVSLDEFDRAGKRTGTFQGRFEGDRLLRGAWSSADSSRNLPFEVRQREPAKRSDQAAGPFQGEWLWEQNGGFFTLVLQQDGATLQGVYSAVTRNGRRIDSESALRGTVNGRTAVVNWTSAYGGGRGRSTLTLTGDSLRWQVTEEPASEYWAPRVATLKRRK